MGAGANGGAANQGGPVGVAGAQHDLVRIKPQHLRDELGKHRLMPLPTWARDAVERNLIVRTKADGDLVLWDQTATRGLQEEGAPDSAQRAPRRDASFRRRAKLDHSEAASTLARSPGKSPLSNTLPVRVR